MNKLFEKATVSALVLCLVWLGTPVSLAHEVLGPVAVNSILKSIGQARQILAGESPSSEKEEAVLEIGFQAHMLMKLINAEIQEHGREQQGLIDLAIRRSRQMDVQIEFSDRKKIYLYDFAEFVEYLKMAPQGEYAADARFALMEQSFYQHTGGEKDPEVLEEQLGRKQEFLEEYPDFKRQADLELLITLDYYELYALHLQKKEAEKAQYYKDRLLGQCRRIVDNFPDTAAADLARNLLFQLQL